MSAPRTVDARISRRQQSATKLTYCTRSIALVHLAQVGKRLDVLKYKLHEPVGLVDYANGKKSSVALAVYLAGRLILASTPVFPMFVRSFLAPSVAFFLTAFFADGGLPLVRAAVPDPAPTPSAAAIAPLEERVGEGGRVNRPPSNYPTPYAPASVEQIEEVLRRVHAYLETATPIRIQNTDTHETLTDLSRLPPHVAIQSDEFRIVSYEWGVTYAGLLLAAEVTGDSRYREYVARRLDLIAKLAAHAKAQGVPEPSSDPTELRRNQLRHVLTPRSLDDCGAMCAAMIKAQLAGASTELRPWIDNYMSFIRTGQMRLADGTLARNRPLANSLWLDDLYMSVPALAQMAKLTNGSEYFEDAAKQIIQFNQRMFVPEKGLYMHGWVEGMSDHPAFHWARANGWAIMAAVELLDVLPADHPSRPKILEILRAHVRGLAAVQGHDGLWHQLLDRPESYGETSGSAMYVFAIARAINRGWIDSLAYGPMVTLGWNAIAQKVNTQGQVEATCVGTGMGWDPMFYMYRPVSVYAGHGYGPLFLAGAEMIALRKGKGAEATIRDGGLHFGHAVPGW